MLLLSEFFFFQCIGIRKLRGFARPLNVIQSSYNFAGFISMSKRNIKWDGQSYLRTFIFWDTLGAMGDNPDRKSGRVPCRNGGVDRLYPNACLASGWGMNLLMSFSLNCQRFSVPQRLFRAQQRLGGLLASWMWKWLRSLGGRPLMMMI